MLCYNDFFDFLTFLKKKKNFPTLIEKHNIFPDIIIEILQVSQCKKVSYIYDLTFVVLAFHGILIILVQTVFNIFYFFYVLF